MMDNSLFSLPLTAGNVNATFPDSVMGSDEGDDKIPWPDDRTPPPPPLNPQRCLDQATIFIIELMETLDHRLLAPEGRNFLRGLRLHLVDDPGLSWRQRLQYRRAAPDVEPEPLPGPEHVSFWQTTYDTLFAQYESLMNAKGFSKAHDVPYRLNISRRDPLFGDGATPVVDDLEREFGRNMRVDAREPVEKHYLKRRVQRWMTGVASDAARMLTSLFFPPASRPARVGCRYRYLDPVLTY